MKNKLFFFLLFLTLPLLKISSQTVNAETGLRAISENAIKAQLGFLASDWMEGRMAGEKGEFISADYIASMLQLYGIKPAGDIVHYGAQPNIPSSSGRSYFQNFTLLKSQPDGEQLFKIKSTEGQTIRTMNFAYNVDFSIRQSTDAEFEAPVIFAGYGFKNDKLSFNDFAKLDIRGKFILKITGTPLFAKEKLTPAELFSSEKEIEKIAKAGGAAGIIEFNPNTTIVGIPVTKEFNNMSPSENYPRPSLGFSYSIPDKKNADNLIKVYISARCANEILQGSNINVDDYIKNADNNTTYTFPSISGKSVYLKTHVNTTAISVRNIIGVIEGNKPDEILVLGAHYDHIGMNNGYIWNGADDNGSGTVGVMTLAKAISESGKKPDKTIIFALWTAEEEGLLGSKYYLQNLTYPLTNIKLNVNFDMISRYTKNDEPKNVTMTYSITCPQFKELTVKNLNRYGIDLKVDYQPSAEPPGGSDHRSFVAVGIPVMRFKPGHREEYHTPDDELGTINWDIMEKIIKISFANIWELANSEW